MGALLLAIGMMAMTVVGASSAIAAPTNESFASYAPAFGLWVPASLTTDITQPALVQPGATYSMSVGASTQAVPSQLSGESIVYTTQLKTIIPVPSGATYVPGSLSSGLQWTFVNKGVTTHGTYDVTYCTGPSANCNATPHSSTFLGSTSTPYIETYTGSTQFTGGGTLTLPTWSASFKVSAVSGTIQPTVSEYDYTDNVAALGVLQAVSYPSGVFSGPAGSAPPYLFQPLATTSIGAPHPIVSAVLPNTGPVAGGSTVTILGSNLSNPTKVTFGNKPAKSFSGISSSAVSAVVPAGVAGKTVNVHVSTAVGTSGTDHGEDFTWTNAPIVTKVSPSTGSPSGGTSVVISGLQLSGATAVHFGSKAATSITANSTTSITAVSPPGSGGVDVTVTNGKGTSSTNALDRFGYHVGYWLAASDGGIFSYNVPFDGSAGATPLNKPVVGAASTADAGGYWLAASDGGVFSYGDATFFGSAGDLTLNKPVVGIAASPTGQGYWLVASDGGVFNYGAAAFYGSTGNIALNAPIVGITPTPDGGGYWLVASDGGVFSFGDANFFGSMGGTHLNMPVVGIAATPDGHGYWMVASDGGVFSFGDANFYGSMGGMPLNKPVVGIAANPAGGGYWLTASDGGIFNYGSAGFFGSAGALVLNQPVVGIAPA